MKLLRALAILNVVLFCLLDAMCRGEAIYLFIAQPVLPGMTVCNLLFFRRRDLINRGVLQRHIGAAEEKWINNLGYASVLIYGFTSIACYFSLKYIYLRLAIEPGLILALILAVLTFCETQ